MCGAGGNDPIGDHVEEEEEEEEEEEGDANIRTECGLLMGGKGARAQKSDVAAAVQLDPKH